MRYLLAVLLLIATPALAEDDLMARDWSVNTPHSLDAYSPGNTEVGALVNKVLDSDWNLRVCSYKFVDPARDGQYRLVASVDASGRHLCINVVVIGKKDGRAVLIDELMADDVDDVKTVIHDLNGDRHVELVLPTGWTAREGANSCIANWLKVYAWKEGHFVDQSRSYPDIYKVRLKALEESRLDAFNEPCAEMEEDRIARFQGGPANTGFDRAAAWMADPSGSLRRKAAAVFADINDEASKKNLAILAADNDPLVAETAKQLQESAGHKE